jgi:DNA-binding MarR family transcriptional regulator
MITDACGDKAMERLAVHVAMIGQVWDKRIEYSIIRKAVDRIVLVYDGNVSVEAHDFLVHLQDMAIEVVPVPIEEGSFSAVLSAVLGALSSTLCDGSSVEFNITCASKIMTVVASVAAAILHGSVVCSGESSPVDLTEVWPLELTSLTRKKMEVLQFLAEQASPVYQRSIAKELNIPQSGISRYVKDMELAGYLSRETISRRKVVCISELGSAIMHSKRLRKKRIWAKRSEGGSSSLRSKGLLQKHNSPSWETRQLQGAGLS